MASTRPGRRPSYARRPIAHGRQRRTARLGALAIFVVAVTTVFGWQGVGRPGRALAIDWLSLSPAATSRLGAAAADSTVLSSSARRSCPAAASACVDLSARLTWLQSDGTITYGPVRMEPGPPGTPHKTPRGTFHVEWKAGAHYVSTEYHEPMPYAVFFAPGGIAFHGGSLSLPSHGCVHLDIGSARYYHDHLPVGAEVVVF
jgi:L,D-transpeptidase catalytic domain